MARDGQIARALAPPVALEQKLEDAARQADFCTLP